MLKVFFPDEIKEIESLMKKKHNLSDLDLIENAVLNLTDFVIHNHKIKKDELISVVIGPGNNGEDGLGLARELEKLGYVIKVLSVGKNQLDGNVTSFESEPEKFATLLEQSHVIIDAIFGIGLNRQIKGAFQEVIQLINKANAAVYSVDIPSGLDALSGMVLGEAVKADYTLVIGAWKTGLLLNQGLDYIGKSKLIEVAIDYELIQNEKYIYDEGMILKRRNHFSNKYDYGNVLTIGGQPGMFGAPTLSAIASLRSGSGLSRIALREEDYPFFTQMYPELVIERYQCLEEFKAISEKIDAFAFGVGIKRDDLSEEVLDYLLNLRKPLVVDATGISLLNKDTVNSHPIIITPHLGELVRLTGLTKEELLKNPFPTLKDLSRKNFVTLLKGPTTIIELKDKTLLLPYGSPGMATAGMGDLLTGMILSFLGKKYTIEESVLYGAVLHIHASLLAIKKVGEESFIASDALKFIGKALEKVGTYET